MIKLVRLDERLIHGQVAIKWSRHTGVDRIVVANDEAAANKIIQQSLMMAAPATAKVTIRSVADSITLLKDPRAAGHKILVIISNPKDLIQILEEVKDIPRRTYGSNLYAYEDEVEDFKKVLSFGIDTVYQTTPEDNPEKLSKILGL